MVEMGTVLFPLGLTKIGSLLRPMVERGTVLLSLGPINVTTPFSWPLQTLMVAQRMYLNTTVAQRSIMKNPFDEEKTLMWIQAYSMLLCRPKEKRLIVFIV